MNLPPPEPGSPRRIRWGAAAAALLAAVAIAVYVGTRRQVPSAPTVSPAPTPVALKPAPDFEITMYQGQEVVGGSKVRLSRLWKTGKPVVLNFFAGLCPPCRAEMPDLQNHYDAGGKDRYLLVTVDIGPYVGLGTRDEGKALLKELKITFPAGTVFDEDILGAYQILGMPTTLFITTEGRILRKHVGLLTPSQIETFTRELIR